MLTLNLLQGMEGHGECHALAPLAQPQERCEITLPIKPSILLCRYDCLVNPGRLSMRMLCCALMCNSELTRRVVYATPMQAYAALS